MLQKLLRRFVVPWCRHNVKVSTATEWLMLVNGRVECTGL